MILRADVYKQGIQAAILESDRGTTIFSYLEDYKGPPVATSLPLAVGSVTNTGGALPPFFAGLLPEGHRLSVLATAIKTSQDNELALLLEVGGDVSGDVQIMPARNPLVTPPPRVTLPDNLAEFQFSTLRAAAGRIDKVGIAGVQDKVSAARVTVPVTHASEHYILKLSEPKYPHLIENEAFFLGLAHSIGLIVPDFEVLIDSKGDSALLIKRFDRTENRRLAFEDASQVIQIWPANKYDISAEEACQALIEQCDAKVVAARELFQQVAFAVITGNGDQHAKNLGILQQPSGEWRVSPAYDLPATVPYGDYTLALPVMGQRENVSRRAMISFGEELGLPKAFAERELDSLLDKTEPALANIRASGLPFDPTRFHHFDRHLRARRRNLRS